MALTRDEIVTGALTLLEEVGLEGLTLRRLAQALGISAPTLYWHVRDKRELLDLMVERMLAHGAETAPLPEGLDWSGKMELVFTRRYEALIAHRDGALVMAGNRPTEAMLPRIEHWLGDWIDAGFPPDEALTSILALGNYVLGSALEYQAEAERRLLRPGPRGRGGPKEAFPRIREALAARGPRDPRVNFTHGLRLMIEGLRHRQARLAARPPGARP